MRKELEEKALWLTRELLRRFWQLDIEYALSLCANNVMWVAPEQNRYMRGIDAMRADLETTRALLAHGADPNARLLQGSPVRRFASQWALPRSFLGATPLFIAAAYREAAIVRELLAWGAAVDAAIGTGVTPLLVAVDTTFEKEVRPTDLARWNIVDSDFPEVPTAEEDVTATVRLLLEANADARALDGNGSTALHPAASNGWTTVIQLLADRGTPLDVVNKNGATALALATPRTTGRGGQLGSEAAAALLQRLLAGRRPQL